MKMNGEKVPLIQDQVVIIQDAQYSSCRSVATSRKMLAVFLGVAAAAVVVAGAVTLSVRRQNILHKAGSVDTVLADQASATGYYRYAAVTTDNKDCAAIGVKLLAEQRGSAVDAAIAVSLCTGLQSMDSCGIGGGHFMTIFEKPRYGEGKEFATLNARETAPKAAENFRFNNSTLYSGGTSVGVPGEIAGLYEAWQMYGRLAWADLFQPSIDMATTGIYVGSHLAMRISAAESFIRQDPALREVLVKTDGTLAKEGDYVVNLKLAKTLQVIANEGPTAFYNGSLTADIVNEIQQHGGLITTADLASYTTEWMEPLQSPLPSMGWTMVSPSAPSSGPTFQFMLRVLDGYNFTPDDLRGNKAVTTYQRIVETLKFGYARRTQLSDPNFVDLSQLLKNLTTQQYIDWTRSKITDDRTHDPAYYEPAVTEIRDEGTSHISILAADGAAVSMTSTINSAFGAKFMGSKTGIIYNNEMDDFSLPVEGNKLLVAPTSANYIAGGKRAVSSMCPTIMVDSNNNVQLVIGASGATRITSAALYVTAHNLWLGKSINTAIDTPRLHHQLNPNYIRYESKFDNTIKASLASRGHESGPELTESSTATVQAVRSVCSTCDTYTCRKTCVHAVADGRKGGLPDGY